MPNATAQLVVDLLFRRGVFFFSGGIGEDVLGNLFSSKDLLGEQVKAENKEGSTMRLQSRAKERIDEKTYSRMVCFFGGALLSSMGFFPLSTMALGFFLWRSRERRCEVMEVYASGFAEHQGGYFMSCGSALGVMTGWRTLMGIPNDRVFFPNAKGFH
jgi:hypothetical protein